MVAGGAGGDVKRAERVSVKVFRSTISIRTVKLQSFSRLYVYIIIMTVFQCQSQPKRVQF